RRVPGCRCLVSTFRDPSGLVLDDFGDRRIRILRGVRAFPQNSLSHLPEPPVPGAGRAVPSRARDAGAAGSVVEPVIAAAAALVGRSDLHRASLWQSRRAPTGDAGIGAGTE